MYSLFNTLVSRGSKIVARSNAAILAKLVLPLVDDRGGERHFSRAGHQFGHAGEFDQGAIIVFLPQKITVGDCQPGLAQSRSET